MPSSRGYDAQRCLGHPCTTCMAESDRNCVRKNGRTMLYAFHKARKVAAGIPMVAKGGGA
jgi:hypothetical protein